MLEHSLQFAPQGLIVVNFFGIRSFRFLGKKTFSKNIILAFFTLLPKLFLNIKEKYIGV